MSDYRYELKFILDQADYTRALSWLYVQTSAREAYPARYVNSIYFDDPGYSSVRDNLAGISERKKIRLRWYHNEEPQKISAPRLEVKYRKGRLGHKDSFPVKGMARSLLSTTYGKMLESVQEEMGVHETFLFEDHLFPALMVSYRRAYFEALNGVRITFDTDVKFYETLPHSRPFDNAAINYPCTIMEIKFSPEQKTDVVEGLRKLNLTPKRHSKYLVGLSSFGQAIYY
ncbi:MAG: polyphosphate polymerase domain-containing protein [Rhodospirillales bacterium]|nr:polyphosphate polymerase domain-containing protein [Rhodospirillales bacterium]